MLPSMTVNPDDGRGNTRASALPRTQRMAEPFTVAHGSLATSGLLERLIRRFGRYPARDEDVLSHTSAPGGSAVAAFEHDGVPELRELTRIWLIDALRMAERTNASDIELRKMLRRPCQAAHDGSANVEHLLILLKEAWRTLPGSRDQTHAEAHTRLAHVVTLCIEEYYGNG